MLRPAFLIVFIFYMPKAFSQDFHYTQLYSTPQSINPALTGNFDLDYLDKKVRFTSNYRQQWRSIQSSFVNNLTPFNSFAGTIDSKLYLPRIIRSDYIGIGSTMFSDRAGDLNLSSTQLGLMLSYNKNLNRTNNKFITIGYNQSIAQRSINYSNAYYDNQWNGTNFDPMSPSNEPLQNNIFYYNDISTGILFTSINKKFITYRAGIGAFHINNPNATFSKNNGILKTRYTFHGEAIIPLKVNYLYPTLNYSFQGPTRELSINLMYKIVNNKRDFVSNFFGIGTRVVGSYKQSPLNDAISFHYKLNYKNTIFAFSYDVNSSSLSKATNLRGAVELSFVYYSGKNKPPKRLPRNYKHGKTNCPKNQRLNFDLE